MSDADKGLAYVPAFPSGASGESGMTLREHYAGLALAGFCGNEYHGSDDPKLIADRAVRLADALVIELAKPAKQLPPG